MAEDIKIASIAKVREQPEEEKEDSLDENISEEGDEE